MSIINDLAGGKLTQKKENAFNVYIQFDNDEAQLLSDNHTYDDFFEIILDETGQVATFTDTKSGKVFKIIAK